LFAAIRSEIGLSCRFPRRGCPLRIRWLRDNPVRNERYSLVTRWVRNNPVRSERYSLTTRWVRDNPVRNERYSLTTRWVRANLGRNERSALSGTPLESPAVGDHVDKNERFDPRKQQESQRSEG
jgi:hypothetical protein